VILSYPRKHSWQLKDVLQVWLLRLEFLRASFKLKVKPILWLIMYFDDLEVLNKSNNIDKCDDLTGLQGDENIGFYKIRNIFIEFQ
jgi:hypothetical protein